MTNMPNAAADTFDRSCAHWSEDGRREMEHFYAVASVDYDYLAKARDWHQWLSDKAQAAGPRPLRLLDVACGSGKFPVALNRHGGVTGDHLADIEYALLDPSRFSINEARAALQKPFVPADEYEVTLQELDCPEDAFDIAWATHALYAMAPGDLEEGLGRLIKACAGEIFIAHAFADGHYIQFQRLFLDGFERGDETPYSSAEDLIRALDAIGARYEIAELTYQNGAPAERRDVIEGYLQRCIFDDTVSLEAMEASDTLAPYLASCQKGGQWEFTQHVAMISINP